MTLSMVLTVANALFAGINIAALAGHFLIYRKLDELAALRADLKSQTETLLARVRAELGDDKKEGANG